MAGKNFLQIAYDMGYKSFFKGAFNAPYKDGTVLLKEWQRGFNTAYFDNITTLSKGV